MKWFMTLFIACCISLPYASAQADTSTAPGQQKKEAGDGSAKPYAPGQQEEAKDQKKKKESKKAKGDLPEDAPDTASPKAAKPDAPARGPKQK